MKFSLDVLGGKGQIGTFSYAPMAAGMILCAGEAVLAKFAEHYFSCN